MNWLLLRLLAFLLPGIDNDDDPADPADPDDADPADPDDADPADPDDADPADPDDADPADPDLADPDPAPRETRAQRTIRETRERAQRAEADLAAVRADLEAARRSQATPPQQTEEQVLWQQEEETLRNPETNDWQRYSIRSARAARQSEALSRQALARAEDMGDRAAFAELAGKNPKLYSAYKDRVEAKLVELRAQGRNVNREGILKVLIGEDMLAGKLKAGEAAPRKPAAPARARTDVPANRGGGLTEAQKREKRLENVRI